MLTQKPFTVRERPGTEGLWQKIRQENNTEDERDLFTDSQGMEAMFQTRAIVLKIEQDKKKIHRFINDLLSCPLTVLPIV